MAAFALHHTLQTLDTMATLSKLFVCFFQAHINCAIQVSVQLLQYLSAAKHACLNGIIALYGAAQLHFYTMNYAKVMMVICTVICRDI